VGKKLADAQTSLETFFDRMWEITQAGLLWWGKQDYVTVRWVELWSEKGLAGFLETWAEALKPLQNLLSVAKGILDIAANETQDLAMSVENFFDHIIYMMEEVQIWYSKSKGLARDLVDAFDPEGDLGKLLADWAKSLEPLAKLLSVGQGILDVAAKKTQDFAMAVEDFFDYLIYMMEEVQIWESKSGGLARDLVDVFDPKGPLGQLLSAWATALEPLATMISVAEGLLGSAAEATAPVLMNINRFFNNLKFVMETVRDWIAARGDELSEVLGDFGDPTVEGTVANTLAKWAESLGPLSDLLGVGKDIMGYLGEKVKKLVIPITGFLSKLLNLSTLVQRWVEDQGADFAERMETLRDAIVPPLTAMKDALDPVADLFGMLADLSVEEGEAPPDFGKIFAENILPGMQAIVNGLLGLQDYLAGVAFEDLTAGLEGVRTAISDMLALMDFAAEPPVTPDQLFDSAHEAGISVADGAIAGVNSMIGAMYAAAFAAGQAVGQGLVDGLLSMLAAVAAAAAALAAAAAVSIGDELGMGSPSKVMMEMGQQAQQSFLTGLGAEGAGAGGFGAYVPAPVVVGGGGPTINVNIAALYGTDDDAANRFGDRIALQVRKELS